MTWAVQREKLPLRGRLWGLYGDRLLHPPKGQESAGVQRLYIRSGEKFGLHQALPHQGGVGRQVLEGDYLYGMVSNTTSVGRFRNFPPGNPDLSDGLLEVTLISPIRDVKDMEEFSRALLMTDPSILNSMMTTFSTAKVKITAAAELLWTLGRGGRRGPPDGGD